MSAPPRLVHSSKSAAIRQMLEAGVQSRMPAHRAEALASALGIPPLETGGAFPEGQTSAAGGSPEPTAIASVGTTSALEVSGGGATLLGIGKSLLLGVALGGMSSGGYWAATGEGAHASRASTVQVAPSAEGRIAAAIRDRRSEPEPPPVPQAFESTKPAPRGGSPMPNRHPVRALGTSSPLETRAQPQPVNEREGALAYETRLVDGARKALATGDPARASTFLDRYDATRQIGVLDREALVLRLELLHARGDREGARALAERYAERYPGDAHIGRLRALLGPP